MRETQTVEDVVLEDLLQRPPSAAHRLVPLHLLLLLQHARHVVLAHVVRILRINCHESHHQDQQRALVRLLVPADAETRERQHAAADHHRRALESEVVLQSLEMVANLLPLLHDDVLHLDAQQPAQHVPHLLTPDPVVRAQERGGLVAHAHQQLLNLPLTATTHTCLGNRRDAQRVVVVQDEEGDHRLQRPVRAAPALVIHALLVVVEVQVVALHEQTGLSLRHVCVDVHQNPTLALTLLLLRRVTRYDSERAWRGGWTLALTPEPTQKQMVGVTEFGTISGNAESSVPLGAPFHSSLVLLPRLVERREVIKVGLQLFGFHCREEREGEAVANGKVEWLGSFILCWIGRSEKMRDLLLHF